MLQRQLMDLLARAQRGGWGGEPLDASALCGDLERCTERGVLLDAADGVMHHQGRYPALQDLQGRFAAALVRNPLTPKAALLSLAEDGDLLQRIHPDLCRHPNVDEQVLLEAAYTASQNLLPLPELYRSLDEAAPGLGRAAEVVDRMGISLAHEYQQAVRGLRGQPQAVEEVFATLLLDSKGSRAVHECLEAAVALTL